MVSSLDITPRVKMLLGMADVYDDQLAVYVPAAMQKLANEGVPASSIGATNTEDYILCVSYQVQLDIDLDVDRERLTSLYMTRVNTLRTSLLGGADDAC